MPAPLALNAILSLTNMPLRIQPSRAPSSNIDKSIAAILLPGLSASLRTPPDSVTRSRLPARTATAIAWATVSALTL